MRTIHIAYALHYPLVLSPDAIWLAIAQAFAEHVKANAELLRGRVVRHGDRATITIQRHDFVKGSRDNDWPATFSAFSEAVAKDIGRQRDLVVCDFSTTGPCERAASEIVLLDAMQKYFGYHLLTLCGIPAVTLEGTAEDWRSVRRRAGVLAEYDLGWWMGALAPVLDELVATSEGRVDIAFWKTFYKHVDGSGGPWVRGWINVFFPYLCTASRNGEVRLERNKHMEAWRHDPDVRRGGGASAAEIPSGLACVPFAWEHYGTVFPMEFLGGFVGVAQDEGTLALRPAIGWAVGDAGEYRP
jgi:hypothetical protein